jgi:hypothetical protein
MRPVPPHSPRCGVTACRGAGASRVSKDLPLINRTETAHPVTTHYRRRARYSLETSRLLTGAVAAMEEAP